AHHPRPDHPPRRPPRAAQLLPPAARAGPRAGRAGSPRPGHPHPAARRRLPPSQGTPAHRDQRHHPAPTPARLSTRVHPRPHRPTARGGTRPPRVVAARPGPRACHATHHPALLAPPRLGPRPPGVSPSLPVDHPRRPPPARRAPPASIPPAGLVPPPTLDRHTITSPQRAPRSCSQSTYMSALWLTHLDPVAQPVQAHDVSKLSLLSPARRRPGQVGQQVPGAVPGQAGRVGGAHPQPQAPIRAPAAKGGVGRPPGRGGAVTEGGG